MALRLNQIFTSKGLRLLIVVDKSTNKIQVTQMEQSKKFQQSESAIGRLPKPKPIVENFWIDFSICLNCSLFVDLSTKTNPSLTKPCENLI